MKRELNEEKVLLKGKKSKGIRFFFWCLFVFALSNVILAAGWRQHEAPGLQPGGQEPAIFG